jgi:hypothetical protein
MNKPRVVLVDDDRSVFDAPGPSWAAVTVFQIGISIFRHFASHKRRRFSFLGLASGVACHFRFSQVNPFNFPPYGHKHSATDPSASYRAFGFPRPADRCPRHRFRNFSVFHPAWAVSHHPLHRDLGHLRDRGRADGMGNDLHGESLDYSAKSQIAGFKQDPSFSPLSSSPHV